MATLFCMALARSMAGPATALRLNPEVITNRTQAKTVDKNRTIAECPVLALSP